MAEDREVLEAIDIVCTWLRDEWIVSGCAKHPVIGCASCEAIELQRKLILFSRELEDAQTPPRSGESIT